MNLVDAKEQMCAEVDQRAGMLTKVAREIHARPELAFEERFAAEMLVTALTDEGIGVVHGAFGLDTAFSATAGVGGPTVAVVCEYDALPGIGHACGHNIIAATGLGAGLAAAALADRLGGRVKILGTPAEEGGGGKALMIDAGAFADVDAAVMVHPAGSELLKMNAIAVQQVIASYRGRSAHAAAAPQEGRNALDAAVLGYSNVAALRQHTREDERIHGVFLEAGERPNVVPARASSHWYLRSGTLAGLDELMPRVAACLEAGALAAGCEVDLEWLQPRYADMRDNAPMLELYCENARALGRLPLEPDGDTAVIGSTDMGNVSYVVPSIHPMIAVSPPEVSIHTDEFATWSHSDVADRAVLDGAKALAMTVADLWARPEALDSAREAFETSP